MIHNFLFFIDINSEASTFVEYVFFVIRAVINFTRKASTAGKNQLSFGLKGILSGIAFSMITWFL